MRGVEATSATGHGWEKRNFIAVGGVDVKRTLLSVEGHSDALLKPYFGPQCMHDVFDAHGVFEGNLVGARTKQFNQWSKDNDANASVALLFHTLGFKR